MRSEPWIDVRDEYLRADIEMLADVGIIKVPVTTYPLMWSGIIKDIDQIEISQVPSDYKEVFWRVKQSGKRALANKEQRELRVSAANSEQVIRSFGDGSRGKAELSGRSYRMTKSFAWNIEVTQVYDPIDEEKVRYDGSYISAVHDNWIFAAGAIDKWWGPTWESSNILSNNARPPLGLLVQRNYSNRSELPLLNWFGPWSFNAFVASLNDERVIEDAKLTGAVVTFKPHSSIEVGLRATALWGGNSRTESFDSFIDNFIANESCILNPSPSPYVCNDDYSDTGDRIAGMDFRWKIPVQFPVAIYASAYGEDEKKFLPSKFTKQFGMTSSFSFLNSKIKWYFETSDTSIDGEFNQAYESQVYQTGYRYYGRSIGSTYDNDSESLGFGILGRVNRNNKFSVKFSKLKINQDGINSSEVGIHSLTQSDTKYSQLRVGWIHNTQRYGTFDINLNYIDKEFENVKSQVRIGWTFTLQ